MTAKLFVKVYSNIFLEFCVLLIFIVFEKFLSVLVFGFLSLFLSVFIYICTVLKMKFRFGLLVVYMAEGSFSSPSP